jgi:hypothetical protein
MNPSRRTRLKFSKQSEESRLDFKQYPGVISQIIGFKNITIEMCGNWIWLSGNTFRYRKALKKIGFLFADKKKLWYWRPNDYKSANQKPKTMEYIRKKYGSDTYPQTPVEELTDKN